MIVEVGKFYIKEFWYNHTHLFTFKEPLELKMTYSTIDEIFDCQEDKFGYIGFGETEGEALDDILQNLRDAYRCAFGLTDFQPKSQDGQRRVKRFREAVATVTAEQVEEGKKWAAEVGPILRGEV